MSALRIYGVRFAASADASDAEHWFVVRRALDELVAYLVEHDVDISWPSLRLRIDSSDLSDDVIVDLLGRPREEPT